MTEKSICHPLRPVCVLLNLISAHLYRKNFMSPNLTEPLITDDTTIRFLDATQEQKQVSSDPTVAYTAGPFDLTATSHGAMSNKQLIQATGVVTLTTSTASKALTQELSFELGSLCMAMMPLLRGEQCIVLRTQISDVQLDPNSTFFLATTAVNISLGYPVWNVTELEGILREIRINV